MRIRNCVVRFLRCGPAKNSNETPALLSELSNFSLEDLCTKAGAIQLIPENADFFVEMVCGAAQLCALPLKKGTEKVADATFADWINSPL